MENYNKKNIETDTPLFCGGNATSLIPSCREELGGVLNA